MDKCKHLRATPCDSKTGPLKKPHNFIFGLKFVSFVPKRKRIKEKTNDASLMTFKPQVSVLDCPYTYL